jgi:NAD-dependent deacetylase
MSSSKSEVIAQARSWIKKADAIAVLTGAGISAESGVPTFRGAAGLWKQFRPEDLATPEAFARHPELVWEWYDWRRSLISKAQPNPGHCAIAGFERRAPKCTLITQNVDGLHQRAGSQSVVELHGSIWRLRCTVCNREWSDETVPLAHLPPTCSCGGLARPAVVWFGESLPAQAWCRAEQAAKSCDVFLVVGTSALVYPAAGLASLARSSGAKLIEINAEQTVLSNVADLALTGLAGEILPAILSE